MSSNTEAPDGVFPHEVRDKPDYSGWALESLISCPCFLLPGVGLKV